MAHSIATLDRETDLKQPMWYVHLYNRLQKRETAWLGRHIGAKRGVWGSLSFGLTGLLIPLSAVILIEPLAMSIPEMTREIYGYFLFGIPPVFAIILAWLVTE
ncbi:MAG: hypothetical protein AB8B47_02015 [Roseobacter sp.]